MTATRFTVTPHMKELEGPGPVLEAMRVPSGLKDFLR